VRNLIHLAAFLFIFTPLSTFANSQPPVDGLAHCFVHKPGCTKEIAAALSDTDSATFEQHLFNAIDNELQKTPREQRHIVLRNLLALKSDTAFALFWKSVRHLKLDLSELIGELEIGTASFSPSFQRFTQRLIKNQKDFELANIYFDMLYFFEDSEWTDLDKLVDLTYALYLETKHSDNLKPTDASLVRHLLMENSANQLDKDDTDFKRLQKMWKLAENIKADPVSAYEKLSGDELYYSYKSEYYKAADRYFRDFSKPKPNGKLPNITGKPTIYYEIRTQQLFINRLWSDRNGNTLLIDTEGQFLAFNGEELVNAKDIWKIYRLAPTNSNTSIFSKILSTATHGLSDQYEKMPYTKFSNGPGAEKRIIFVNQSLESDSETANYIELSQRSNRILVSMDLPDNESGTSVKQFIFEFKTPDDAAAAINDLSTNTPTELTQTPLWYHNYDNEKQGLILRAYIHGSESDMLISPYKYDDESLDFPKWGSCDTPFSIESLNQNSEAFFKEEHRLYRLGYRLKYFNLFTTCTITMPWDSETDVVKRAITGFKHYDNTEAIESLESHRVTTRPYRLALLDTSDSEHLIQSRIGGTPVVPKELADSFPWPQFKRNNKTVPLEFLMQINFSELNNPHWNDNLPDEGLLSIYYHIDENGDPSFARGYYFDKTDNLVKLKPKEQDLRKNSSYHWKTQRILYSEQLAEQYPIREWGAPYDRHNVIENIDDNIIQAYYDKTYGIGAYSKDSRASYVVNRDYPVFIQLKMHDEDLHIILNEEDMQKPTKDGFKTIGVHPDWMGHYD
jgi:uncharacterized protein YwqG